jgi:hypothetical protein
MKTLRRLTTVCHTEDITYSLVTRVTRKAGYLMHVHVHASLTLRPTVVEILSMNKNATTNNRALPFSYNFSYYHALVFIVEISCDQILYIYFAQIFSSWKWICSLKICISPFNFWQVLKVLKQPALHAYQSTFPLGWRLVSTLTIS